ncbi:MAG: Mur ligase family protein [Paracoccaceae bacterium]
MINGGVIHAYGSNARAGAGEWMVVEADESDGSFNRLPATIAIVTNIDPEHMEHWGTIDALRKGFLDFVSNIPFYGLAVLHRPPRGAGAGRARHRPPRGDLGSRRPGRLCGR